MKRPSRSLVIQIIIAAAVMFAAQAIAAWLKWPELFVYSGALGIVCATIYWLADLALRRFHRPRSQD
jgi:hypothetical protein